MFIPCISPLSIKNPTPTGAGISPSPPHLPSSGLTAGWWSHLKSFIITLRTTSPLLSSKGFNFNSPGAQCAGPLIKEFASVQKKGLLQIQLSWRKISALLLQNYSWEQQLSQSPSDTLHLCKSSQSTCGKCQSTPWSDKGVDNNIIC